MEDRTVKIRAFSEDAKIDAAEVQRVEDKSSDLAKMASQLEEERGKSLELLKDIVNLRDSLKREQAKSADLEAKLTRLTVVEESQLAKKNALLEEEKKRSLEYMKTIEQLRDGIKQDQAKAAEMAGKSAEMETKAKELAALEAKVKELSGVLSMIARIAASGKLDIHI